MVKFGLDNRAHYIKKEWITSEETSLYLSSMFAQAAKFATIIRQHWSIENSSHYVKDVT
ncbi:MAG: hypothetical protein ACK5XF_00470 [Neisseriaceae bacterium]